MVEIKGTEVYFSNGHKCGDLIWDKTWERWRFKPMTWEYSPVQTFDHDQMIDIGNAMKRLRQ